MAPNVTMGVPLPTPLFWTDRTARTKALEITLTYTCSPRTRDGSVSTETVVAPVSCQECLAVFVVLMRLSIIAT